MEVSQKNIECKVLFAFFAVFPHSLQLAFSPHPGKGWVQLPNRMNFWKFFKRPSTPPPSFLENYVAIFLMDLVAYIQGGMR